MNDRMKISVLVGGMASEKQKRILKKCPEIIVATPGRLWEMIEEGESHLSQISNIRYLVIDETDRMVEKGHFAELTKILDLINGNFQIKVVKTKQKLEKLINLIGMKDPKIIDITKKTVLVDTLTETQLMCSNEQKDYYLYYFLIMHPGRTLVFCNSKDCVRRLRSILELLECHPLPLHASMHQRQRLKNLERFEQSEHGILLSTDVAARGLDIKGIEHVIHFQVPRTAETYVHRSGRTARAENEGLSLLLIEPQDGVHYKRICKTLNKEQSIPTFPIDHKIFKLVKDRVTLAHIDDNLLNDMGEQREQAAKSREIKALKKQLKFMLSKPITSQMFTGSFPTKSGKLIDRIFSFLRKL
ncbi:ATP-dependent RNA helicase DDX24 [Trichonephila inaurata madagascariensis]|uniref:ATP-dependent RNA helicase n=1 Tax=Trichonephila inaurata madagascariensis TaxID=2747483 RepID=A0A8X7C0V4_9ARAC|nr:ATP-dependent RNA helicase DDX24 [Trichonephila inaurata madagascariensis]